MDIIIDSIKEYPWFTNLVIIMGTLRLIFKPMFSLINVVVEATPTEKDNKIWRRIQESKQMRFIVWLVDYFASIKLPNGRIKK